MQGLVREEKSKIWKIRNRILPFAWCPLIMGILNITPDSFYDGGRYFSPDKAIEQGLRLTSEGADILDVGGLSTRPGSRPVAWEKEAERVVPVISALVSKISIPISVDTYRAPVARQALEVGASAVNDIGALRMDSEMSSVISKFGAGLVLMHMRGDPASMQENTLYENLLDEILEYLQTQMRVAGDAGISPEQIIVDPGIGFGKDIHQNMAILKNIRFFKRLGRPVLVGPSRKSFIGRLLNRREEERLAGTLACVYEAFRQGAEMIRVHDVKETADFLKMIEMLEENVHKTKETSF